MSFGMGKEDEVDLPNNTIQKYKEDIDIKSRMFSKKREETLSQIKM